MRFLVPSIGVVLLLTLVVAGSTEKAEAVPGDALGTIERAGGCYGGNRGVGVAFHPPVQAQRNYVWYSCQNPTTQQESNTLYFQNIDDFPVVSSSLGMRPTKDDAGHNIPIEALAWDENEEVRWGVNRIPVAVLGPQAIDGICAVWRLDWNLPNDAQLAFTFDDPDGGCDFFPEPNFVDGLTIDEATDTIYLSYANGPTIRHFNKDGTPAAHDGIDFDALTAGICDGSSCRSSGLVMGVDGTLVSATGQSGKLVRLDLSVPEVVAVYDTSTGRDWDIECGPAFVMPDHSLVNTILSADLYSNVITMMQAPDGVCDANGYSVRNAEILPASPFNAKSGQILYGWLRAEYLGFGSGVVAADDAKLAILTGDSSLAGGSLGIRLIAAPGDRCFERTGPPYFFPHGIPCAEGDLPLSNPTDFGPSIGGQACWDGVDNDGNGLVDAADPACRIPITWLELPAPSTGEFEWVYRPIVFLCYWPGDFSYSATFSIRPGSVQSTNPREGAVTPYSVHCSP